MPDNSIYAYNYFLSQGWSEPQSAGIVGNLIGESGLNTNAIGDSGSAYGIAQWHSARAPSWLRGSSLDQQLAYVNAELNGAESAAGKALRSTTNVADATRTFMQKYERPANMSSFGSRLKGALGVLGQTIGTMDKIKGFLSAPLGSISNVLGTGGITDGLGLTGDCNYICQFRKWLSESHFWQRVAIVILALIVIAGAMYLLGNRTGK